MTDESINESNLEYFEAKAKDGWIVKVLGNFVNERLENDDWTVQRAEYLVAKSFRAALDIAFRLIKLHGGPSTERPTAYVHIPVGRGIRTIDGLDLYVHHYWLDEDGQPAYGQVKGQKCFAASKKTHDGLCKFIESKLLPKLEG